MCASFKGHAGAVELLLAHEGIDVNQTNTNGWTALMRASFGALGGRGPGAHAAGETFG